MKSVMFTYVLTCVALTRPGIVYGVPVIIDFEILRHVDALDTRIPAPIDLYIEDGFSLAAKAPPGDGPRLKTFGTLSDEFPGSTAMFHGNGGGEVVLTANDGQLFNLYTIELAEVPSKNQSGVPINSGPFGMTFFGTEASGNTISATFTVDSFLTLKTFAFVGFENLVAVNWFQGGGPPTDPTHQFDNIVLAPITASAAVPEPLTTTLGLMSFGVLGMATRHRAA